MSEVILIDWNMIQPIAAIGTQSDFAELFMTRDGDQITLHCRGTEYTEHTGRTIYTDIGSKTVCDEDAVNAACDLWYDAAAFLDARGGRGYKDNGLGFGEAVEKVLDGVSA